MQFKYEYTCKIKFNTQCSAYLPKLPLTIYYFTKDLARNFHYIKQFKIVRKNAADDTFSKLSLLFNNGKSHFHLSRSILKLYYAYYQRSAM